MKEGRFMTTGGMGTMGYSIPAAMGAKMVEPKRQAVAVCGDGAFQMAMSELATMRANDVDLKIIIKEGNRASQKIYWHPDKAGLNEQMSRNVYNIYVGDKRKKIIKPKKQNVKIVKTTELSIETAILFLVENGFTGQLTRHPNPYTTETVDLSKL
jgi:deoxyxylulose-5-phosphate synthase